MTPKQLNLFHRLPTPVTLLLILFLTAGCGGDSSGPASSGGGAPDPKFSLPLPKGLLAPGPDSGLTMTAKAVIDPGNAGARTIDLTVDLSANRVTGVIDGVAEGPRSIEIQYFINGVQVAIAALNINVVAGQNTPVEISPTLVKYIEAVSNTLFVADSANRSIAIFDHYSSLQGGTVQAVPTRTLASPDISEPSSGGLFVDPLRGILYITNTGNNSVAIWNNAATVNGNTPPDRLLSGTETRLNHPTGITVDPFRNRIYVVNQGGEILIWDNATPVNGNAAPTASVSGAASALVAGDHPLSLDIKTDTLYVANGTGILVFNKLSQLTGDHQDIAPAPTFGITGKPLIQAGLALDPARDRLFISSGDPNGTIYKVTGASAVLGDTPPAATLTGPETGLNQTSTILFANNILMATNQGGSEIRVWHQADQKDGNASPTQILQWPAPTPPAPQTVPSALFYVATQNLPQDQGEATLKVTKAGNGQGRVTSDPPGINCGTICSAPYPVGNTVKLTAVPEDDSTFVGWDGACSGTGPCAVTMDAVKSVTATFALRSFALTVNKTGNGAITSTPSGIDCGTDCSETYNIKTSVTLTALPAADSNLVGWTGCDSSTGTTCTVLITEAKTVTATFDVKPLLTVTKAGTGRGTVTSSPAGINCGTDCSESYHDFTTRVTLTPTPNSDSDFTRWSGCDITSGTSCTVRMTTAKTVTAAFTLKTFQLNVIKSGTGGGTVTSTPSGIDCGPTCQADFNSGTPVTLSATPATGSTFAGWSGDPDCTDGSVTMTAAKSCTATFTLKPILLTVTKTGNGGGAVTSDPPGIICDPTCSENFDFGTTVTLTAKPNPLISEFAGWSGEGCSGTGPCIVKMDAARSVTAMFNLIVIVP